MRSHRTIIEDAGGATKVAQKLNELQPSADVKPGKVQAWKREDSIPGEYWRGMEAAEFSTLRELATAAERRKLMGSACEAAA